jgi:hypothetical protein
LTGDFLFSRQTLPTSPTGYANWTAYVRNFDKHSCPPKYQVRSEPVERARFENTTQALDPAETRFNLLGAVVSYTVEPTALDRQRETGAEFGRRSLQVMQKWP